MQLSDKGRDAVCRIAEQSGFSEQAVIHMLNAIIRGNASMAQFNHRELGGSGQWMRGRMIMISDMFNDALKARVDGLATMLADVVEGAPQISLTGSAQSHWQTRSPTPQGVKTATGSTEGRSFGHVSGLFVTSEGRGGGWWPAELGTPDSVGSQNDVRYAYFAQPRRLAIQANGETTLYDTLDHRISGFEQQQSSVTSLSFRSQHGLVDLAGLRMIRLADDQS